MGAFKGFLAMVMFSLQASRILWKDILIEEGKLRKKLETIVTTDVKDSFLSFFPWSAE